MASAAMRNSHAEPIDSRSESMSRGQSCGSTTRRISCQVEAPSVCALMICSFGNSPTRSARSRAMHGAMPITMSAIFAVSSSPSTMNSTGRIASGGIIAMVPSSGESSARSRGTTPMPTASIMPSMALMTSAEPMRLRLAQVSAQNSTRPVRLSSSNA